MINTAPINRGRLAGSLSGVAAAAALVAALALTPAGSLAQSVVTIFEPRSFAVVPITAADVRSLRNLPDLSSYGTMTGMAQSTTRRVASASAAAAAAGLTVRTPASLPAGVPTSASYTVLSPSTGAFTFSAARALAAATRDGKRLPPMPARVDGSTLQVTIGPVVVSTYGGSLPGSTQDARGARPAAGAGAAPAPRTLRMRVGPGAVVRIVRHGATPVGKGSSTGEATTGGLGSVPALVVIQAPRPRVISTGAGVREIENYLLAQPGISPQLAAEIRAIGDPSTTLPIPIPVNRITAHDVMVRGVHGLAIGDNTGIGSGVLWQQNGTVYAVAGTLTESQVLAVADGLR